MREGQVKLLQKAELAGMDKLVTAGAKACKAGSRQAVHVRQPCA